MGWLTWSDLYKNILRGFVKSLEQAKKTIAYSITSVWQYGMFILNLKLVVLVKSVFNRKFMLA